MMSIIPLMMQQDSASYLAAASTIGAVVGFVSGLLGKGGSHWEDPELLPRSMERDPLRNLTLLRIYGITLAAFGVYDLLHTEREALSRLFGHVRNRAGGAAGTRWPTYR